MSPKTSVAPRVWGTRFDTLPTTPPASPSTGQENTNEPTSTSENSVGSIALSTMESKEDSTPHEASIFVGSLPANIDQHELTQLLSEHLAEHAEIQNIKVVRDSKGGVCAFVQCEDATAAAILINTLQNRRPKPFLGRHLRYEPARAFRTLIISYRAPTQHIPISSPLNNAGDHLAMPLENQLVQLDLPFAMRIWRNPGSKFYTLSYNAEAITTEAQDQQIPPTSKSSLFLHPFDFDEKSLEITATYFGRLEHFTSYPRNTDAEGHHGSGDTFPSPHDAPRAPGMHPGCWEVKWKNRDDCVAALMTLRRVPHLTATWAHQPSGSGFDNRSSFNQPRSHQHAAAYPFYLQLGREQSSSPHPRRPHTFFRHNKTTRNIGAEPSLSPSTNQVRVESDGLGGISDEIHQQLSFEETSGRLDWSETDMPSVAPDPEQTWRAFPWATRSPQGGFESHYASPTLSAGSPRKLSNGRGAREVDPTTLFVGGLETFGPSAWTEEKLSSFFKDYPGLESIRLVQPQNGNTGFAFVKFNNSESPSRAVLEKHNCEYEGRAMRVQLREIYSPRNYWRHNRGRGRFQPNTNLPRRITEILDGLEEASLVALPSPIPSVDVSLSSPLEEALGPTGEEGSMKSEPPAYSENCEVAKTVESLDEAGKDADAVSPSSPQSSSPGQPTLDNPPTSIMDVSDWPNEVPSIAGTPPVQSVANSQTAVASFPYPTPYYPQSAWIHPYAQPMPYQMPYMAYPSHFLQGHLSQYPSRGPPSEAGSSGAGTPWGGPYGTPQAGTPANDPSQSQALNSRAPLAPTGFIQNEQGTLIAVYQPEALDNYMSGSQRPPSNPPPPAGMAAISANWPQYSQPQVYPYSSMAPVAASQRQDASTPIMANPAFTPVHHLSMPPSVGNSMHDGQSHRTEPEEARRHGPPTLPKRYGSRRDYNGGFGHGKFSNSHRFGNRQTRGNVQSPGPHYGNQPTPAIYQPQYPQNAWNQWGHAI